METTSIEYDKVFSIKKLFQSELIWEVNQLPTTPTTV